MPQLITSLQNPLVKHLVKLRQNRDYRYEQQSVLVEGVKQIRELVSNFPPKCIISVDENLIPKETKCQEIFLVNEPVLKKISGVQSPEGLIAELPMPKPSSFLGVNRLLALDHINDPGNLGTLLRTALALGWNGVYLIGDSCDPFNEKALRAAKGAPFHLPLAYGSAQTLIEISRKNQLTPFCADLEGILIDAIDIPNRVLLVLGNESHGLSLEMKHFCQAVTIPLDPRMESLNVAIAGGILMHSLRKV